MECDKGTVNDEYFIGITIHVLLAEYAGKSQSCGFNSGYYNSRTLCGVRPFMDARLSVPAAITIHAPLRSATAAAAQPSWFMRPDTRDFSRGLLTTIVAMF